MTRNPKNEREQKSKLTKRTVNGALPGLNRYIVMDEELSGFGIRVEASGVKTYCVRYRSGRGGQKAAQPFMTIERHGDLAPNEARKEAKKILSTDAVDEKDLPF